MKTEKTIESFIKYKDRMKKQEEEKERQKKELEYIFGTSGNPKADLLYMKAWDLGHPNGFHEVEYYYGELAELIK